MTEAEARRIAETFLIENELAGCTIQSLKKMLRPRFDDSNPEGKTWVAQVFVKLDDEDATQGFAIVLIDDATGKAMFFETL